VLLLSEIDPVQNAAADTAVRTTGFSELTKWTPAWRHNGAGGDRQHLLSAGRLTSRRSTNWFDGVAFEPGESIRLAAEHRILHCRGDRLQGRVAAAWSMPA